MSSEDEGEIIDLGLDLKVVGNDGKFRIDDDEHGSDEEVIRIVSGGIDGGDTKNEKENLLKRKFDLKSDSIVELPLHEDEEDVEKKERPFLLKFILLPVIGFVWKAIRLFICGTELEEENESEDIFEQLGIRENDSKKEIEKSIWNLFGIFGREKNFCNLFAAFGEKRNFFNLFGAFGVERNFSNLFGLFGVDRSFNNLFGLRAEKEARTGKKKLGWISGVFVPVVLDCFGVILFLRMPMLVGNAGIIGCMCMFSIGYLLSVLTVLSASALATNGVIKSGGSYFMISRILGKVLGGGTGIVFFFANVAGTSLYVIGFVDAVMECFPFMEHIMGTLYWSKEFLSLMLVLVVVTISLLGPSVFEKTANFIFLLLLTCIFSVILSFAILEFPLFNYAHAEKAGYTGWRWSTISDNLWPYSAPDKEQEEKWNSEVVEVLFNENCTMFTGFPAVCNITVIEKVDEEIDLISDSWWSLGIDQETGKSLNFQKLFGILFPAVTGILAGTSLSGDLENPSSAIAKGTLGGTIFTFILYNVLIAVIGGTTIRTNLVENYTIEVDISIFSWLVRFGIFFATSSSTLTSFLGCSRIIAKIAADNVFPFIGWLSNENVSIIITACIVQGVLLLGALNVVAPFVTLFFVLTFAMINLSCFILAILKPPNFRPTFPFYHWSTCLLGFFGCIAMILFVDPLYSMICLIVMSICMVIISFYTRNQKTKWSSVSQALSFYLSNRFSSQLDHHKIHSVRFWRFNALLLCSHPRSQFPLMDFLSDLSSRSGGLLTIGNVKVGSFRNNFKLFQQDNRAFRNLVKERKMKFFWKIVFGESIRGGVQNLLISPVMGNVPPRIVILGYWDKIIPLENISFTGENEIKELNMFSPLRSFESGPLLDLNGYMSIIKDCLLLNRSLMVAKNFHNLREDLLKPSKRIDKMARRKTHYIDIWIILSNVLTDTLKDPSVQLALQVGVMIMQGSRAWQKHHRLRIMCICQLQDTSYYKEKIGKWLKVLRVKAEMQFVRITPEDYPKKQREEKEEKDKKKEEERAEQNEKKEDKKNSDSKPFKVTRSKTLNSISSLFSRKKKQDRTLLEDEDDGEEREMNEVSRSHTMDEIASEEKKEGEIGMEFNISRHVSFGNFEVDYYRDCVLLIDEDGTKFSRKDTLQVINNTIHRHSSKTNLIIATLPSPPANFTTKKHVQYKKELDQFTRGSIPMLLVYSQENVISVVL